MLTPTQQRVTDELLDPGGSRPNVDPAFAGRLRAALEAEARDALERVSAPGSSAGPPWMAGRDPPVVVVSKHALAQVHQCERQLVADERVGFAWNAAVVQGMLAHKAIELRCGFLGGAPPPPGDLVRLAAQRLMDDEYGPAAWLRDASADVRAETYAAATDAVTKFEDSFPPIETRWRPRVESRLKVQLAGGRVELSGKVDLALGQASGHQARTLIIDLKTGRPSFGHPADLRWYALLETLRVGVFPYRLASFYLDSGEWRQEDVTDDLLWLTVRRVTDGLARLLELRVAQRPPTESPGPACHWCVDRASCPSAALGHARSEAYSPGPGPGR
jgi:PD-(D/E)XK nuclease superfamily protein